MHLTGMAARTDEWLANERLVMEVMAAEAGLRDLPDEFPAYIEARADTAATDALGEDLLDLALRREGEAQQRAARAATGPRSSAARPSVAAAFREATAMKGWLGRASASVAIGGALWGVSHPEIDWRSWAALSLVAALIVTNLALVVPAVGLIVAASRAAWATVADACAMATATVVLAFSRQARRTGEARRHRRQQWASVRVRTLLAEYRHHKSVAVRASELG